MTLYAFAYLCELWSHAGFLLKKKKQAGSQENSEKDIQKHLECYDYQWKGFYWQCRLITSYQRQYDCVCVGVWHVFEGAWMLSLDGTSTAPYWCWFGPWGTLWVYWKIWIGDHTLGMNEVILKVRPLTLVDSPPYGYDPMWLLGWLDVGWEVCGLEKFVFCFCCGVLSATWACTTGIDAPFDSSIPPVQQSILQISLGIDAACCSFGLSTLCWKLDWLWMPC